MLGIKFFAASMIHCTEEPCIESLVLFLPEQIVGRLSHHSLLTNNFSLTGLKCHLHPKNTAVICILIHF